MKRLFAAAMVLVMLATGMGVGWAEENDRDALMAKLDRVQLDLYELRAMIQGGEDSAQAEEQQQAEEPAEVEQPAKPKGQSLTRFLAGYALGMEELRGKRFAAYQLSFIQDIFLSAQLMDPDSVFDRVDVNVADRDDSVSRTTLGTFDSFIPYDDPEPYKQDTMVLLYAMLDLLPITSGAEYRTYVREHMDADWEMVKGKIAECKQLNDPVYPDWGEHYALEFHPYAEGCHIYVTWQPFA